MSRFLLMVILLTMSFCGYIVAKSAGNSPYVVTFDQQSPFYAKCIPATNSGTNGSTQIIRLRAEGEEILTTYAWYNRNGLSLGWSPKEGKVAVLRIAQDMGLPAEKQIELSFYIGDQFLRSYTTKDLESLGAKVDRDVMAFEQNDNISAKRALYRVEGCQQVQGSNDYYFSVRLDETRTLAFNILSGELCRIEKDGNKERLVPVEKATPANTNAISQ